MSAIASFDWLHLHPSSTQGLPDIDTAANGEMPVSAEQQHGAAGMLTHDQDIKKPAQHPQLQASIHE
jgi:hypothetical protein